MTLFKNLTNLTLVLMGIGICLYGAVNGYFAGAIIGAFLLLLLHIGIVNFRLAEACVIIIAGIVGSFTEIININLGLYDYVNFDSQAMLLPTWMVLIWFLIGSSARHSLSVFSGRTFLIPLAGVISAVSLFAAGELSGAIRFQPVDRLSMGLAILFWAIAISFILLVGNRFFEQPHA